LLFEQLVFFAKLSQAPLGIALCDFNKKSLIVDSNYSVVEGVEFFADIHQMFAGYSSDDRCQEPKRAVNLFSIA
jgi:hypothetical protein